MSAAASGRWSAASRRERKAPPAPTHRLGRGDPGERRRLGDSDLRVSLACLDASTWTKCGDETQAHAHLMKFKSKVTGRAKLGVMAYAEALLTIPKTLAENAGYDAQDTMLKLLEEEAKGSSKIGLDISTGEPIDPCAAGIYDNFNVKRQMLDSAAVISSQLLLVDEVIRAGRQMKKG